MPERWDLINNARQKVTQRFFPLMSERGFWHFWLRATLPGAKGSTWMALDIQPTCISRNLTLMSTGQSKQQFHLFHSCFDKVLCPKAATKCPLLSFTPVRWWNTGWCRSYWYKLIPPSNSVTKILHWSTTHTIKPLWSPLMTQISYSRADTAGLGVSTQSTYIILAPWPCLNR